MSEQKHVNLGFLRRLQEQIAAALSAGQGEPYDLAQAANAVFGDEITRVAAERDALADAIIGGIEIGDVDSRYHAALHIAGELHTVIQMLGAEIEQLRAGADSVRKLHREFTVYDECGHDHEKDEPGVVDALNVGLVCQEGYRRSICVECCTADSDGLCQGEHCYTNHIEVGRICWPCPTRCAVDPHLGEPVCRCGHNESAHDAGECWTKAENDAHPNPKCACSWYEPVQQTVGAR